MVAKIVEFTTDGVIIFEGLSERLTNKLWGLESCMAILQANDGKTYYYTDGILPVQIAVGEILMTIDYYG